MKLIVDRGTSKVLFAESDETFVDILFSFLTLPIGVVCRLRHRHQPGSNAFAPQTPFGCMDNLFASLMNLHPKYFKNVELKLILSSPKRSFLGRYWSFVRGTEPAQVKKYCLCGSRVSQRNKVCTDNKLAACMCGIPNYCRCDSCPKVDNKEDNSDGLLFLVGGRGVSRGEFIVTDDLKVAPVHRAASVLSTLQDLGVRLTNNVEEVTVFVNQRDKILNLLMRSLVSSSPLSDAFCTPARASDNRATEISFKAINQPKETQVINNNVNAMAMVVDYQMALPRRLERKRSSGKEAYTRGAVGVRGVRFMEEEEEEEEVDEIEEENERKARKAARDFPKSKQTVITIKLIVDMSCRRVLFAEAGEDFVDLLFNFLTYPLCSLSLLTDGGHPFKCFRHLSASLSNLDRFFKSERCRQQLLFPDLPHQFYGSLLMADPEDMEAASRRSSPSGSSQGSVSSKALLFLTSNSSNPKSSSPRESSVKNGVLKDCCVFMVTDDLVVTPLSSMSVVSMLDELNCYPKDVQECKVAIDLDKARALLLASLTTTTALSSTFFPDDNDQAVTLVP